MGVGAERPRTRGGTSQKLGRNAVRLKVEIHEIQFSEVTNYRNPRNPPPISRNPHAKKRNPTLATKSTGTPPKANYRNPPALDGVCLRMALLRCYVQSSTLHSERRHTSSLRLALIIAQAYNPSHRRLIQPGRRLKWTLKHLFSMKCRMYADCQRKASKVWMVLLWYSEASYHKVWPTCVTDVDSHRCWWPTLQLS